MWIHLSNLVQIRIKKASNIGIILKSFKEAPISRSTFRFCPQDFFFRGQDQHQYIRHKKICTSVSRPSQIMHSTSTSSTNKSSTPNYNPNNYKYCYEFPRPSVTTDNIVFTVEEDEVWLLLIKRKNEPYINSWALPGGFVDPNENLELAALRYVLTGFFFYCFFFSMMYNFLLYIFMMIFIVCQSSLLERNIVECLTC